MWRIGALISVGADDRESRARVTAFEQRLQELGWTAGRNVQIDYRWAGGEAERYRRYAAELVGLGPDVILVSGSPSLAAVDASNSTVSTWCVAVPDPVRTWVV